MSTRIKKAAAKAAAAKYANKIYSETLEFQRGVVSAIAKGLYEKYVPMVFRAYLAAFDEYYTPSHHIIFTCGSHSCMIWLDNFVVCPQLKPIEITQDEFVNLNAHNHKKTELINKKIVFERNATENFYKLRTWDRVKKYFPEMKDYIPDDIEESKVLGVEDLNNMAKEAQEGGGK